jgi:methionine synthase I (cobalamin-dependent)
MQQPATRDEKLDLAGMVADLNSLLRLKTTVIGIKMFARADEMEAIQLPRSAFETFAKQAKAEGIQFLGGCCGCNAAYIHAFARGLASSNSRAA